MVLAYRIAAVIQWHMHDMSLSLGLSMLTLWCDGTLNKRWRQMTWHCLQPAEGVCVHSYPPLHSITWTDQALSSWEISWPIRSHCRIKIINLKRACMSACVCVCVCVCGFMVSGVVWLCTAIHQSVSVWSVHVLCRQQHSEGKGLGSGPAIKRYNHRVNEIHPGQLLWDLNPFYRGLELGYIYYLSLQRHRAGLHLLLVLREG